MTTFLTERKHMRDEEREREREKERKISFSADRGRYKDASLETSVFGLPVSVREENDILWYSFSPRERKIDRILRTHRQNSC
jgi:hypothetical protein